MTKFRVIADTLNVREAAGTGSRIVATLPKNTTVEPIALSSSGDWCSIDMSLNGVRVQGWIFKKFLAPVEPGPGPDAVTPDTGTTRIIALTADQLLQIAPNARSNYREAFAQADQVLANYGINANALRLSHFMAQVLHESMGLTILIENMNYRAERIVQVWPTRFKSVAAATPFAHNPAALANNVYGGRMGNDQPGDGSRFMGRGLLQITGRESYERYGTKLGIDLANNPELAVDEAWTLKIACEEWTASNCNAFADQDNLRRITKAINGGYIGLASRQDWLDKAKHLWLR